jgi:hypothetical protein
MRAANHDSWTTARSIALKHPMSPPHEAEHGRVKRPQRQGGASTLRRRSAGRHGRARRTPAAIEATPPDRFQNLPNWSYAPHYIDDLPGYAGLCTTWTKVRACKHTFLCLHGEDWAYLYRKMAPVFLEGRVVARFPRPALRQTGG